MSKREEILKTTLELATNLGLYATSIHLIIKESNASAGTIYHHFKNKEELIDTLYKEIKDEMSIVLIKGLEHDLGFKERFYLLWKGLFYYYIENPAKFLFLEQYANSPLARKEIKEITKRKYQPVIDFIQSGIEIGILRNLPIDFLTNSIFSNISTLAKMVISEEQDLTEDFLKKAIQCSWDSIKIT